MTQIYTGDWTEANRKTAKPPPTTTSYHNYVYLYTRIEKIRQQLAKVDSVPMTQPKTLRPNKAQIDGKTYSRQPHSGESICNDCGVVPGEYHEPRCDRERCPKCRRQLLTCACEVHL
jgi:hypothetical protein